jgi:choline dehydrogenase
MHNAGVASLAQDDDWNFIANQTGDASWEASKMARYFREIEKNHYRPSTEKDHGFNGESTEMVSPVSADQKTTGWLSTNVGDPSWAKAEDNPGTRMLKRLGELLGQNTTTTSSLLENDILAHTPGKDQISSVYNMAYHIDAVSSPALSLPASSLLPLTQGNRSASAPPPTTTSAPPSPTPPSTR